MIAHAVFATVSSRVENDVKLLRNRVRMLQMEHEKAQKKIQETAKKTDELILLRKRNDERFIRVSLSHSPQICRLRKPPKSTKRGEAFHA